MIDKDDDKWVTLLGGGDANEVAERARAEAERLKLASAEARVVRAETPGTDASDAAGMWGKGVEDGRGTGTFAGDDWIDAVDADITLAPPPEEFIEPRPARRPWVNWSGRWVIGSVLGAAVLAFLWFAPLPMLVGKPGGPERLPPILRALPKEEATRIADELSAAGAKAAVTVHSTSDGTTASIVVDTGAPGRPGKTIDEVLARHGVAPPNGGQFVIAVRPAEPARK
jgi:hypothetical protein